MGLKDTYNTRLLIDLVRAEGRDGHGFADVWMAAGNNAPGSRVIVTEIVSRPVHLGETQGLTSTCLASIATRRGFADTQAFRV